MKGTKIGIKEGMVIFIALIVMTSFLGFFYAGIIILALLVFNAYLRNKEEKAEKKQATEISQN